MSCIGAFLESRPVVRGLGGVELEAGEVHVHLAHRAMIDWPCPECGAACRCTTISRSGMAALDTCQYRTILHAEPPRSECRDHGVRVVRMRGGAVQRFTALFERWPSNG